MAARKPPSVKTVDGLLKALMVLSRTVERVLETQAVRPARRARCRPRRFKSYAFWGNAARKRPRRFHGSSA